MQVNDTSTRYAVSTDAQLVPPGYKQTDAGVIPEDWDTIKLIDLCRNIVDFRGRTPKKIGMEWGGGEIPALSARNIKLGYIDFQEECYLGSEDLYKRWMTNGDTAKDDIVLTTEAPLGNVALIPDRKKYILSQRTILLQPNPALVSGPFLFQFILSDYFQRLLTENSTGSTAKGIKRKTLEALLTLCPPIKEQRAIAEALSDVDGLLGALEALIAKKRAIKQAAMQQLLTGKTRLPGFSGEWDNTTLDEVAEIKNGATPSTQVAALWNGTIPWCTPTDITSTSGKYLSKTERYITEVGLTSCAASLLPPGALLLCSRATIGAMKIATTKICTNQGFKSLVCRQSISNEFLYYLVLTLKSQIIERAIGSTFLEIGKRDLASITVTMPREVEQTAIATVLSDMDAEIAALECRRDKTRAIKQGMMQQLLTGRVRLVNQQSSANA